MNGRPRGYFSVETMLRPQVRQLLGRLGARYELALLSGDNERERERFRALFGDQASLHFNHDPLRKLELVEQMQRAGRSVLMVGDGLNDAGALKQSDVGVAVVEEAGRFSPASDVIMEARMVPRLSDVLEFSRGTVRVVWISFLLSSIYNAIGLTIAARGLLSPLLCAILMPLSSITVVTFACLAPRWLGRRWRLGRADGAGGGGA
jgi:Cu+-exporting ATPase